MHELYRPQPGTPLSELDTPCLILDMDALDGNMGVMADFYEGRSSKLRGHSKNHKTPALALRQIRRGGTVGGGLHRQGGRGRGDGATAAWAASSSPVRWSCH